ncbi:MAG: DUF3626 domain-containing protein [Spirochaetaceae bacterium]|jgi:hypothetical protein|nr:DUF3626 domain-containing protein [Spirochaetaceae bacterium]
MLVLLLKSSFARKFLSKAENRFGLRKSDSQDRVDSPKAGADKLAYFKKKMLAHLDSLSVGKSILFMLKAGKPAEVGTIREWKGGKKYIKTASGKWKRKYESESRGIKQSLAAVRRAVDKARTPRELMQIVLENRDRFSDAQGHPLPIVQELSAYVSQRHGAMDAFDARSAAQEAGKAKKLAETVQKIKDKQKLEHNPLGWSKEFPETLKSILDYVNKEANENDIEYVSDRCFKALQPNDKKWLIKRYEATLGKNPSAPSLWKAMVQEINQLIENSKIAVRIDLTNKQKDKSIYKKLMNEFILKNQFETKTSGGLYNKERRDKWESVISGKDISGMDSKERPIYASVDVLNDNNSASSCYGRSLIVFKDSIRDRTTFTIGNSSGEQGAFQKDANTLAHKRLSVAGYRNPFEVLGSIIEGGYDYIEAQIWGRAGIDDIAELKLDKRDYNAIMKDVSAKEWLKNLKAKGIAISILSN